MIDDLFLARRKRPAFRPAVFRLEARLAPGALTYAQTVTVTGADGLAQSVTETFSWDAADPSYSAALSGTSAAASLNAQVATCAAAVAGPSAPAGADVDHLAGAVDAYWTQAAATFPRVEFLGLGLNDCYSDPGPGATIDPSVVDAATARDRVKALAQSAQAVGARNAAILGDINSSGQIASAAKALWYAGEVKTLATRLKSISAELKLIRQQYPDAFR